MFTKVTEQTSLHENLDQKSVLELMTEMNEEDQKVALAVKAAIPQITALVEQIVPRMQQGGRIFYMGAATPTKHRMQYLLIKTTLSTMHSVW